ncbi:MAG: hypothetical protein IJS08_11910 [Victivallales bacterium]|nr:hypothetical protein [Victivallales bacterium]
MPDNAYYITIEEVIVHDAQVKADSPDEAFDIARAFYGDGEFNDPGECQKTRIAVRNPSGETLIDFAEI